MGREGAALLNEWRTGDVHAGIALFDMYKQAMGAVAWTRAQDAEAADAVLGEVASGAGRQLPAQNGTSPGPWLLELTRKAADRHASKQAREESAAAPGSEAAYLRQREEILNAAVEALPENDRELLHMLYIGGLTYAELSDVSGMTVERVGHKLCRIRQQLHRVLSEARL
ncbi:MAG: sigma-70 family RNA polymerase sigma factor [Candidatus Hydrogenedentes bacterium]|nr:sigma-70 family RNA polymerase sigma factor [Candidatus Hydrogenedentota bacterium]